ncbi:LAME_0B03114g1_1 [Lachancea meyersii CBS 8951]|uniref:LAME_0B03114g1_1 n=1 Tax=Lachancea meyersii CBS 8951 TaxID=1266667 RepID=A0A1G4IU38_9SACH|nr:LAME_0B03114g1_1 [Lachancea meyersii CBS 8951]
MVKQKVTSKTSKRYRYSSFKDKIDNLRIEPARDLSKRVHDHVETSHFLASLEHWEDINMSAGFTEFADTVRPLVQTLPQILFHEVQIFDNLHDKISKHDENSLQPLLDLLSQFCHDLGPDFMQFYEKAMRMLTDLLDAAINFESSNVFEWGFNCVAYIYKYLSRILAQDLLPTYNLLFPLLSHRKEYLSRFSAEVLSFLVRKAKHKSLQSFVSHTLEQLRNAADESVYDGLRVLYTEALTSKSESLHSKFGSMMEVLIDTTLHTVKNPRCISLMADIILNIVRHASSEHASQVYLTSLTAIDAYLEEPSVDMTATARILTALSFAESGKKVASWTSLIATVNKAIKHPKSNSMISEDVALLFCFILRNAPLPDLAQCHRLFFSFYMETYTEDFLPFFGLALKYEKSRILSFGGARSLQKFINSFWQLHSKKIALFLLELRKDPSLLQNLEPKVPEEFAQSLLSDIERVELTDHESLYEVFWRLQVLRSTDCYNLPILAPILTLLLNKQSLDDFEKDVIGTILEVMTVKKDDQLTKILTLIFSKFEKCGESRSCVEGLNRIVAMSASLRDTMPYEASQQVMAKIAGNLSLPDDKIRYETLKLIIVIREQLGQDVPQIFRDCRLIEEIPRNLQTARDVTMRLKAMGTEFAKSAPDELLCGVFFNYLFGSLTVRFSPAWEGVYQILPDVFEKDQQLTWELFLKFIDALDNNFKLQYYSPSFLEIGKEFGWSVSVSRLNDSLQSCKEVFESYFLLDFSIIENSKQSRSDLTYPGLIRNQALKGLLLIPQLAERHSRDIVPYFLKSHPANSEFAEEDFEKKSSTPSTWSEGDRKQLLQLIGKFKNIKAIFRSEDVHQRLMDLLGSRTTEIQKMALDGILAYREKAVIKYRDNLKNLLDDNAFKDECLNLLSYSDEPVIDVHDEAVVMPVILRILFGRAQTPVTSGLKKSRKTAAITLLPNLTEKYVIDFLKLASHGVEYQSLFCNEFDMESADVTSLSLRRMTGFVTLAQTAVSALGSRYPRATATLLNPVLYAIYVSNEVANRKTDEDYMVKQAGNVRQLSMKLMLSIFSTVGDMIEWDDHVPTIHKLMVGPRLAKFEDENLQKPSSLMLLISLWATDVRYYKFLYHNQCSAAEAFMRLLSKQNAKEEVLSMVLTFSNQIVKNPTEEDEYLDLISLVASSCLKALPSVLNVVKSQDVAAVAVDLLLNLIEAGYVRDIETKQYLLNSLGCILEGELKGIRSLEKVKVVQSVSFLLEDYQCDWDDINTLYKACSKLYRTCSEKELRLSVNAVFSGFARIFKSLERIATLLNDLNAFASKRMETYDFETVLPAFKKIDDGDCMLFSEIEWLPVLNTCLFYIRDEEELALRTNATHTLKRFIDYVNSKESLEAAQPSVDLITSQLLPDLKNGLRHKNIDIQAEFISVTAYVVGSSEYYTELDDMKVLLFNGDQEANFFTNVAHIQLHRRQRAIKRLGENGSSLTSDSIAHFLIPMIEHYVYCTEERYRNICNETISTIGLLSHFVTWSQYKALMRRFTGLLESKPQFLKEVVSLVVACSKALATSMDATRSSDTDAVKMKKLPATLSGPETFIKQETYPKLMKILNTRNDETIVARIPLCEALVESILGLDITERANYLPGILSSVCQVLRSRSEELREAVRKNLASISVILGPEYLSFILKELRSALRRGSQIHVLSYTIHSILVVLSSKLQHKDLDTTASMIVNVIMEDTFGSAGQEKDAEGYTSKLKELKYNKSYDTAEIVASNISLAAFGHLLHPIKALLKENLGLKNQRKLDELMRRYSLGLNHNVESSSSDALILCYEIFTQSTLEGKERREARGSHPKGDSFFLINLSARNDRVQNETKSNSAVLRKFALDLLKTILTRNANLLEAAYLENFVPLLQGALDSDEEEVLISALRVLIILVKLEFMEENEGIFKNCARKVLNVIRDSPSTSSELCQVSLKFLSSIIRHKDIELKDTALSFILGRIRPDLNEPNKQGLAFNFVKSLVFKHIVLPELYDVIDAIAEIMVTNHSKEIRDVSRSVCYQFLMEYDQSRGRLEKQFKFLVSNLEYPSQEGRQSVMELINLIVNKSGMELLLRVSSSFFLSLSNVAANDGSPRCREMGTALLKTLLMKLGNRNVSSVEKYITAWLKQSDPMFVELGLKIYKIYLGAIPFGSNNALDTLAISKAKKIISESSLGSAAEWNLIYTALNVLSTYVDAQEESLTSGDSEMWSSIIDCLLYPQPWVRVVSGRMVGKLIQQREDAGKPLSASMIQNIAYRTFHQLGAPSVSESLATTAVKTLITILRKWISEKTAFIPKEGEDARYDSAVSFSLARIGSILRDEENFRETFVSKKASVQLFALITEMMDETELKLAAGAIILPLFTYLEDDRRVVDEQVQELQQMSQECLEMLQTKLSVSDFSSAYSNVKQEITRRRYERRAKRAALAVTAPEAAARRKFKKHARSKEKRRHEKDDNGFYRAKNKKRRI